MKKQEIIQSQELSSKLFIPSTSNKNNDSPLRSMIFDEDSPVKKYKF
jgi:hypothetical protein